MRFYLLTAAGTERFGENIRISPPVLVRSLTKRAPNLMVPLAGEEVELQMPDGQTLPARVVSVGVVAWQDSEGHLYTNSDPTNPSLTLTITGIPDGTEVPGGTEIWLPNARSR